MSWLTPGVIDILIAVGKALVILLVVELRRASSARPVPEPLWTEPRGLGRILAAGC